MAITTASDNKKGGTGKTTTAFNLGTLLAGLLGQRVLLIDLDSDRCLTDAIGGGSFEARQIGKRTILDCLVNPTHLFEGATFSFDLSPFSSSIQHIGYNHNIKPVSGGIVHIIAGSEDLAEAPNLFATVADQPVGTFDQALRWIINQPSVANSYDHIILDIGTGWDLVTKSALFAADQAIIPVEPASLSIEAFKRHNLRIARGNRERAQAGLKGQTKIAGVLISRVNEASPLQVQFAQATRNMLVNGKIPCYTAHIPTSDAILLAMKDHVPAWGIAPSDKGTEAFISVAKEFIAA